MGWFLFLLGGFNLVCWGFFENISFLEESDHYMAENSLNHKYRDVWKDVKSHVLYFTS